MNIVQFPGCDERLYDVTVLSPVTYRLWAPDEETAKRRASILRPEIKSDEPVCVGFPDSISVKEVTI